MSNGEMKIDGNVGRFELRIPTYEVQHVDNPETVIRKVTFRAFEQNARFLASSCREVSAQYVCNAEYQFIAEPEFIEVESELHVATVPNHVHLLRVTLRGRTDQAVLDASFRKATLRFRDPTLFERTLSGVVSGLRRALGGVVQWLFLAGLVLAARSRRELIALTGMFLLGQAVTVVLLPMTSWQPAPRFVEAAMALTLAYLAVEILLLPEAGARWAVAGVLGLFHGLHLHLFLRETGSAVMPVVLGAAAGEIVLVALVAVGVSFLARASEPLKPVPVLASGLLITGLVWFLLRLRG